MPNDSHKKNTEKQVTELLDLIKLMKAEAAERPKTLKDLGLVEDEDVEQRVKAAAVKAEAFIQAYKLWVEAAWKKHEEN